ncbi:MAG: MMPL family transporter [Endomicrobium sp.]|jgi:predicted exporter|nr:MMPL family transporter [Endomicrobium sp.]
MRLKFNLSFIYKYRKLYLAFLFAAFVACSFMFSKIRFGQDISEMLPSVLSKEIKLFGNSPISSKIFVTVEGDSPQLAHEGAETIMNYFTKQQDLNMRVPKIDEDFILSCYYEAPQIWNDDFQKAIEPLITKDALSLKMKENAQNLYFPAGSFMQKFILSDPIGMIPIFAGALQRLNISSSLLMRDGFISSADGTTVLIIFDSDQKSLDLNSAAKYDTAFKKITQKLPAGVTAFYTGAERYTVENNDIITTDLKKIFLISSVLMTLLFAFFFRDKKALFIYAVPPVVIAVSAVVTYRIFGGISAITLGFGAVLMGLCIDYAVYMYFALRASKKEERFLSTKKMFAPLSVSAATSILTFALLFFSGIGIFRQIALFCAFGLALALFIALCTAPFVFDCKNAKLQHTGRSGFHIGMRTAFIVAVIIFAAGIFSIKYVNFNVSLEALNTTGKRLDADLQKFRSFTGDSYKNTALLFVFGQTREEVLENNEKFTAANVGLLKLAELFPSQKTRAQNIEKWKTFWTTDKMELIKNEINVFCKNYSLNPESFDAFYSFLESGVFAGYQSHQNSLLQAYNPIIEFDGRYAFANIIKEGSSVNFPEGLESVLISNNILRDKITVSVLSIFIKIMIVLLICSFAALSLMLKDFKLALVALLPPVCGICCALIVSALSGIEYNLFGLFAMPLLAGLAMDYGIFMIYRVRALEHLHPLKSVVAAALSTLIGFGSLMVSRHNVLFVMGFTVFIGIAAAIASSIFLIPAFLQNYKNSNSVKPAIFILCFLCAFFCTGCLSSEEIRYNVREPESVSAEKDKTLMFYGSYGQDLYFRVITVLDDEGVRVVIMTDLGLKLQDMKIKKDSGTDMYFVINFMPKNIIEDFEKFFRLYFLEEDKKNIKTVNKKIYFYDGVKPLMWVRKI